jgi:hypothetical protein
MIPPVEWSDARLKKRFDMTRKYVKQMEKSIFKSPLLLVFLLFAFFMACQGNEVVGHRFLVTASGNFLSASQAEYRQVYGQLAFMPEIKTTCLIPGGITVWGGLGLIGNNGYIEEVDETAHIQQTFASFGVGYARQLGITLRLRGEIGLAYIAFKEEAFDETSKGSGIGWKVGACLDYFLARRIFVTLAAAFSQASYEGQVGKVGLGGFQVGAGLGFAL